MLVSLVLVELEVLGEAVELDVLGEAVEVEVLDVMYSVVLEEVDSGVL